MLGLRHLIGGSIALVSASALADPTWPASLAPAFEVPKEYRAASSAYPSVLAKGETLEQWPAHRQRILEAWHNAMGAWPALLEKPELKVDHTEPREGFTQQRVTVQVAENQRLAGYLLLPPGQGAHPAVLVPFYDPETSVGLAGKPMRDFALQLTKRGFVTLSIGSPGGSAFKPDLAGAQCQPLSYHAYIAANCHTVLAQLPQVDAQRIGVVGHSYGGKWAMFASCLHEKFACAAWSDPGIAFDETRGSINYWEPWYLGLDAANPRTRKGLLDPGEPRRAAYAQLYPRGLHELHSLMAPRPLLVSGGIEDPRKRWESLARVAEVYEMLGADHRVGMTNRPLHDPNAESNAAIYAFFEACLKR